MPVTRLGPFCSRCGVRPAREHGVCRPCGELARAFGRDPEPRFDGMVDLGAAYPADDPAFELELRQWIGETG